MSKAIKKSLKNAVEQIDNAKKVNPLDLSADQDLTIALMNMIAIEKNSNYPKLVQMVRDIRTDLMRPMLENVQYDGDIWPMSEKLLGKMAEQMDHGNHALESKKTQEAYAAYDAVFDAWVIFMGILCEVEI
ncbi:MAG: hypothetical protein IKW57_00375 [Alphaproteobacteria bacterium]|nr:hypothetical protein [Alphaproteobacteria bacterium]